MTPDIAERAVEIVLNEQLCQHEGGHAAAALLQDLNVVEVSAPFHRLADVEHADDDKAAGHTLVERRDQDDRAYAISVLAPRLAEPYWPPRWPLSLVPEPGDEAVLTELVKAMGLDEAGYDALLADAHRLAASRRYKALRDRIAGALQRQGRLDSHTLQALKEASMERKTSDTLIMRDEHGTEVWNWRTQGWPPSDMFDFSAAELRAKALEVAAEHAPVQVARFDA